MKVYLGTDHAGYPLKEKIKSYLIGLGYDVEDLGAFEYNQNDDYPDYVTPTAKAVAADEGSFGIVLGASGQGEAMCANRIPGVRAMVFYGQSAHRQTDSVGNSLDIIASTRSHNDANVLSLAARFITEQDALDAVRLFLESPFSNEERHMRRISKY